MGANWQPVGNSSRDGVPPQILPGICQSLLSLVSATWSPGSTTANGPRCCPTYSSQPRSLGNTTPWQEAQTAGTRVCSQGDHSGPTSVPCSPPRQMYFRCHLAYNLHSQLCIACVAQTCNKTPTSDANGG